MSSHGSIKIQTFEKVFSVSDDEVMEMKLKSHHFTVLSLRTAAFLGESDCKRLVNAFRGWSSQNGDIKNFA